MKRRRIGLAVLLLGAVLAFPVRSSGAGYVQLTEVPDYTWYAGCFGTATGNLMGYWDRHGFPNFYTGPTGSGLAPLETWNTANKGIRSMWASKAGMDGRPLNQPGHIDDYWVGYANDNSHSYESTAPDPYVTARRTEHAPDCVGDFIGLSQKKWSSLAGECDGNIDAYSFVFWDKTGQRRSNYAHTNSGQYIPDIQSGLRAWARYRGYDADVFTQLTSFNPERTGPEGFSYADVKAEIDAGYPVLCFLQPRNELWRNLSNPTPMPRANPEIHGVMIYGYIDEPSLGAAQSVLIRTSWGLGTDSIQPWAQANWLNLFPVRGVIGFRPRPQITGITRAADQLTITWDGPAAQLQDMLSGAPPRQVHAYQLEQSGNLKDFTPVGTPTTARAATVPACCGQASFYRVRVVSQ